MQDSADYCEIFGVAVEILPNGIQHRNVSKSKSNRRMDFSLIVIIGSSGTWDSAKCTPTLPPGRNDDQAQIVNHGSLRTQRAK
jgi:hypothetical protein